MKRCSVCHEEKPETYFSLTGKGYTRGLCKQCQSKKAAAWGKAHPESRHATAIAYHERNRERINAKARAHRRAMKDAVISAYGGKCVCCGETAWEFLALDHVNGGGGRHLRAANQTNAHYKDAIRRGFPPDYRILCHNCNVSIGIHGYCPHGGAVGRGRFKS